MKKEYSRKWKSSTQPRKQRKYAINAPLHIKTRALSVHLLPELRKKHGMRHVHIRKGDKVKILRGQFKGKEGKVEEASIRKMRLYISKIERDKKDGSKTRVPIHPSNVIITELAMDDKRRKKKLKEN
ncbi:MAG: 50S ribosomal protein L24 [Nanoarchaeota archaeon]